MNSAYTLAKGTYRAELTEVGKGTPMGELLRRYWHPVGLVGDAGVRPRKIRALGEDLILFRDRAGRPGLLYPRCMHRGCSLYFGRTEERGIRCCYHGWLFDVEGNCLEQPCEPDRGRALGRFRQPGYPLRERYGLIFAYLGPPDRLPVLPRFDVLETLMPGEFLEADDGSIGSGGPQIVDCNWLQHYENVMDPYHVPILHGTFSGLQFTERMGVMPEVTFATTPRGIMSIQLRRLKDGKVHRRMTEAILPTIRAVSNPRATSEGTCSLLGWVLPIDDAAFRIYSVGRVTEPGALRSIRSRFNGRQWQELTSEEHRDMPGDYEAQTGQGPITLHSEEHLVSSDAGIALLRRLLEGQIRIVQSGRDPLGVSFDPSRELIHVEAGTSIEASNAA